MSPYWVQVIDQFIPATTLWNGGNLIENNILSPALLSFYILWGGYTDINNGIQYVNNKLKLKK